MNLVLTSNLPSIPIEVVYQLMRQTGERPRIAWIPPFEGVEEKRFAAARKLFAAHGFDRLEYFNTGEDGTESSTRIEEYDVIYLSGGDPIRFRTHLLQGDLATKLRNYIENGKMIVAASGGSMQFTRNISVFRLISLEVDEVISQWEEYEGLGLVPYEFLPHLNTHDALFLERVRKYSEYIGHPVIGVEDGGALIHTARDDFRVLGRASIFRSGDVISEVGEV